MFRQKGGQMVSLNVVKCSFYVYLVIWQEKNKCTMIQSFSCIGPSPDSVFQISDIFSNGRMCEFVLHSYTSTNAWRFNNMSQDYKWLWCLHLQLKVRDVCWGGLSLVSGSHKPAVSAGPVHGNLENTPLNISEQKSLLFLYHLWPHSSLTLCRGVTWGCLWTQDLNINQLNFSIEVFWRGDWKLRG